MTTTPLTWAHDSEPTTITIDNNEPLTHHRVLLRSDGTGFLYDARSTQPVARMPNATLTGTKDTWTLTDGTHTWTYPRTLRKPGCSSCGGR